MPRNYGQEGPRIVGYDPTRSILSQAAELAFNGGTADERPLVILTTGELEQVIEIRKED